MRNTPPLLLVLALLLMVLGGMALWSLTKVLTNPAPVPVVPRVAVGGDVSVMQASRAVQDLAPSLSAGPQGNPWSPAAGVRVGPRVDVPPPPPFPIPELPLLPVARP